MYKLTDISKMLEHILPNKMKVGFTIDEIRLKSILKSKQTFKINKKSFFYTILGITQSESGLLGVIPGFAQLIPGSYKSDKPINLTGID